MNRGQNKYLVLYNQYVNYSGPFLLDIRTSYVSNNYYLIHFHLCFEVVVFNASKGVMLQYVAIY